MLKRKPHHKGFKRSYESLARLKAKQKGEKPKSRFGLRQKPAERKGKGSKRKRTLYANTMWSQDVKQRDNFNCQRCGVHSKQNHAHHIAPRSRRPDLKFDRANGITLCAECHRWVHEHPVESTAAGLLSDVTYEAARKEAA